MCIEYARVVLQTGGADTPGQSLIRTGVLSIDLFLVLPKHN